MYRTAMMTSNQTLKELILAKYDNNAVLHFSNGVSKDEYLVTEFQKLVRNANVFVESGPDFPDLNMKVLQVIKPYQLGHGVYTAEWIKLKGNNK